MFSSHFLVRARELTKAIKRVCSTNCSEWINVLHTIWFASYAGKKLFSRLYLSVCPCVIPPSLFTYYTSQSPFFVGPSATQLILPSTNLILYFHLLKFLLPRLLLFKKKNRSFSLLRGVIPSLSGWYLMLTHGCNTKTTHIPFPWSHWLTWARHPCVLYPLL